MKYFDLKSKYKNYIVIIKNGIFYNVYGNDAYILNSLFNYKISCYSDNSVVGFPLKSLNKVLNILDKIKINYLVYENEIVLKRKFNKNQYNNIISEKINNIIDKLKYQENSLYLLDGLKLYER